MKNLKTILCVLILAPFVLISQEVEEVIVTANKKAETVQEIPMNISVITEATIEERGITNPEDYLRSIAGVSTPGGSNYYTFRGLNTSTSQRSSGTSSTYIDEIGGSIAAIENGYIENEITRSAYEYQRQVEEKERLLVGVNIHEKEDLSEQHIQSIDSKKVEIHIKRLKDLKKKRNNLEVQSSLDRLKRTAKTDENVMPQIINCVRSKCTLGEISDALRKVYGEY